jgi:hypothetical protein
VKFLTQFWSLNNGFTVVGNKMEGDNIKMEIYAKGLSLILRHSISDRDKYFTVISLQIRFMTKTCDKEM